MLEIALSSPAKTYHERSAIMQLGSSKKYRFTTSAIGIKGKPYCAFFAVVFLAKDDEKKILGRRIQWLNDFSGAEREYAIVCAIPDNSGGIRVIYRINDGTPIRSGCHYKLQALSEVSITEVSEESSEISAEESVVLPRIEELSPNEELTLEGNIVWIFSPRRSGSTWLGRDLLSDGTVYMHEPDITEHMAVMSEQASGRFIRKIDSRKEIRGYFFSELYKNTWQYWLRKLLLYRIYAHVQDVSTKIIVKEPSTDLDVSDVISSCMPHSKIILLIRDGRDIIDSFVDARQKGGWQALYPGSILEGRERQHFIERQSKIWVEQMRTIMNTFRTDPTENKLLVRYEDLLSDTENILTQIYKFIGVRVTREALAKIVDKYSFDKIPPTEKGKGKFYRVATPGMWKENFSKSEIQTMNDSMGETLGTLGYEV